MHDSAGSLLRIVFSPWLTALVAAALWSLPLAAATFVVNSTADVPDATPGDGVCETVAGNHVCTLRAAIQEANALAGPDTILLQANSTYLLTRSGVPDDTALNGDLDILDSVTITGAGPTTIIDGNGAATEERVLDVFYCIGNVSPKPDGSCPNNAYVVVNISGVTVQNGHAAKQVAGSDQGGGIRNSGDLTLDQCVVTGNMATWLNDFGGGIVNYGKLTINRSVVSNNITGSSNAHGGGVMNGGGKPVTITDSTISGNSTGGSGGGIYGASFKIIRSTISGNSAGVGGGMYAAGTNVLINSTISGNYSNADGGGLYVQGVTTGLYNVTVTQNQANADSAGSAIGGGVSNASGTLTFNNSIIAGNTRIIATLPFPTLDFDECSGSITSQGHSLLTDVQVAHCTISGPYTNADVALGPLQSNGGFTQTHALPDGSAAIDAGNPSGCTDDVGAPITTDQRGVPRPYGPACDAGAFEAAEIIFRNGFES